MKKPMKERTNERIDEWKNGRMKDWTNERMDEGKKEVTNRRKKANKWQNLVIVNEGKKILQEFNVTVSTIKLKTKEKENFKKNIELYSGTL